MWPEAVTDEYLTMWSESAGAAGDSETMLIADRALGTDIDLDVDWECGPKRARQIARMTPLEAARLAARWGSPFPEEDPAEDADVA